MLYGYGVWKIGGGMRYSLLIEGMHCASCTGNVEKSLKKIKGVEGANVSLLMKKGIFESKREITDREIIEAVERAGYKVKSISRA